MVKILKLIDDIDLPKSTNESGNAITVYGDYFENGDKPMGDKIKTGDNSPVTTLDGNGNTVTQTYNKSVESKEDNLFKKPLFYLGFAAFIYFMAVAWGAYNLQQKGLLGNKTFKEIVLAPIPLLKNEDKK